MQLPKGNSSKSFQASKIQKEDGGYIATRQQLDKKPW
jgi:hypothetical protein